MRRTSNFKPYRQTLRIRANEWIRVPEVFLVDQTGKSLGVTPTAKALQLARAADLDLVEVSPTARPPVCKILDFGKYKYEQTKAQQRSRRGNEGGTVKEVRLGVKIDDHDFEVKAKRAEKFLGTGNKVKVGVLFRGREITHAHLGETLLNRFVDRLARVSKMEQAPTRQGRSIHTILSPN